MFGSISRPVMTVIFASSVFLIGHWISALAALSKTRFVADDYKQLTKIIVNVVPDFERFNWRSAPIYNTDVPISEILNGTLYAAGWILAILAVTSLIFRRRDFV